MSIIWMSLEHEILRATEKKHRHKRNQGTCYKFVSVTTMDLKHKDKI